MTWKFVGRERGMEPIPGIPPECSDEEFEAAAERYEARYGPEGKGSVKRSGLYQQSKPEAKPKATDEKEEV